MVGLPEVTEHPRRREMNPVVGNSSASAKRTPLMFFRKFSEKEVELKKIIRHRQFV